MALLKALQKLDMNKNQAHGEIDGTYTIFTDTGITYLQIDTYGSAARKMPGKKSQSIQFGPEGIHALKEILRNL